MPLLKIGQAIEVTSCVAAVEERLKPAPNRCGASALSQDLSPGCREDSGIFTPFLKRNSKQSQASSVGSGSEVGSGASCQLALHQEAGATACKIYIKETV
jgi:hypothetical protein